MARGRIQRRSGPFRVAVSETWAAVALALTTAVLALVVEDALPKTHADARVDGWRWLAIVVVLGLLVAAIVVRGWVYRRTGTLFYLRLLDDPMPDLHQEAVAAARRGHMSTRSVTRWVDLPAHTTNRVIDLVAPCQELAVALQHTVNLDREDTGYTVAPNMLWPVALAVGRQLPDLTGLTLIELPGPGSQPQQVRLDRGPGALCELTPGLDLPGNGRVGLWLRLTKSSLSFSDDKFEQFGVTTSHTLQLTGGRLATFTDDELAQLAEEIPRRMVEVKTAADTDNRELVIVAMMPKSVAFAAGWRIAQTTSRFFTNTHLMHYHRTGNDEEYLAMRVHPAQPTSGPFPAVKTT